MSSYKVFFHQEGLEVTVPEGSSVMEAINAANIYFDFPCGGKGKCGKCRIKVLESIDKPTATEEEMLEVEEIQAGTRLACVTKVNGDMTISFNKLSEHKILLSSAHKEIQLESSINKKFLEVELPSLDEPKPDWDRVKDALLQQGLSKDLELRLPTVYKLPEVLRQAEHQITAVAYGSEILGFEAGDTTKNLLGMAFDIGTTTIVGYLIDLVSGKELAVVSTLNPQTKYGADVISRITFASQDDGLEKLHTAVKQAINKLVLEGSRIAGVKKDDIYAVTIAGNTTMHHLFVGISPKSLSSSPYISVINDALELNASELGIDINQAGKIFVLPNIAGFVGADTVAVLLTTELDKSADVKLMVDIGTNGEIVLGSKEKLFSCSAAAGPAFEGAEITYGMRGAEGAIDHVYFKEKLEYSVIGDAKPKGIAGSGLLDIVAGLLELGIINEKGRLLPPDRIVNSKAKPFLNNLVKYEDEDAFLLADSSVTEHGRSIVVTQSDIRQLQLAKGAMVAGIRILMDKCGVEVEEIKEVLLAGAFGNYMNPHSACVIGLIPEELEDRIKMIGNAAGMGSKLALLSSTMNKRASALAKSVGHVELASYPNFRTIFAKSTYFSKKS